MGAPAHLYTEVFGKHNIVLNSFNAGFSVVNSLPACHALILGRKGENICTQSTWSRAVHSLNTLPGGHRAGSNVRGNLHV